MENLGEKDLGSCHVWILYLREEQLIDLLPGFSSTELYQYHAILLKTIGTRLLIHSLSSALNPREDEGES